MAMRVVFMGTPEFSVPVLSAIHDAGHQVVATYSQPPRKGGRRGLNIVKSPVHQCSDELGIPVYTPISLKSEEQAQIFADHRADIGVVVAYGLLLPQVILDAPRLGCINGHASMLPRWRGAAPIQRAIMAGDKETAMMVMRMEKGLDTGPVGITNTLAISPDTTGGQLHDELSQLGAQSIVSALHQMENSQLNFVPQDEAGACYAKKIDKSETRVNWAHASYDVHNHIRALSPAPSSWCEMQFGEKLERVKILRSQEIETASGRAGEILDDQLTIACGTGGVRLLSVQRAGGKVLDAQQFLRGNLSIRAGLILP